MRSTREVDFGPLTAIEGQINGYLVNFQHRFLNVAPYNPGFNPPPAIIANVGSVTTYGVDVAGTLHFGEHFEFYDAVSYNRSTYNDNYYTGSTLVQTAGKVVPLTPDWLEKFVFSTNFGPFEAQINGDYIGQRYVTYTNDLHVNPTFQMGLEASYTFEVPDGYYVHRLKLSGNMTNVGNTKGVETPVVTTAAGGYAEYPIAPRMWFVTCERKALSGRRRLQASSELLRARSGRARRSAGATGVRERRDNRPPLRRRRRRASRRFRRRSLRSSR